jgi:pimeloyl-ACP methyl ester carboxylesterase
MPGVDVDLSGWIHRRLVHSVDWETLLRNIGAMESHDFDWSEQLKQIKSPTELIFADADSIRPEHTFAFRVTMRQPESNVK